MKILFSSFEASPFAKTGGLGDVIGSLPSALSKSRTKAAVIMPKHKIIPVSLLNEAKLLYSGSINIGGYEKYVGLFKLTYNKTDFYFVDNEEYFGQSTGVYAWAEKGAEQSVFFCRACLELIPHLDFIPDVIHCNDWQTSLIPAMLKYQYSGQYPSLKSVLTIHNLQYQGIFEREKIQYLSGLPDECFYPVFGALEFYGRANLLKAGIVCSDTVNTVSPTYSRETLSLEYGEKLEGVLYSKGENYCGILNGLDYSVFNPETDPNINTNYSPAHLEGKKACRQALCNQLGLECGDLPIISVVSRLVDQKGLDLVAGCIERILWEGQAELVVLGNGDPVYESFFTELSRRYPRRMAALIEFNAKLANQIYAGSDIFLMPSRFEPCGLSQLIAMKYGTVPLVRETGGLADTVIPYNQYTGEGTGFSFAPYCSADLEYTLCRAIDIYRFQKDVWNGLMQKGMNADFSWNTSAKKYIALYKKILAK